MIASVGAYMTTDQKLKLGMEIIAGMKASAYRVSLEDGRLMVADDMDIPAVKKAVEDQAFYILEVITSFCANNGLQLTAQSGGN